MGEYINHTCNYTEWS